MYSKNCFPIKATLFFKPFQLIDSDRELKKILTFLCECFFNRSIFFHFPVKKTKCAEYALSPSTIRLQLNYFSKKQTIIRKSPSIRKIEKCCNVTICWCILEGGLCFTRFELQILGFF